MRAAGEKMKSRSNKGRGRPGPDAVIKQHIFELERSLKLEQKFMANASAVEQATGEDAFVGRDVAARKLRFLKTWFELPSEAFITCLNLLDRFLTKLKVTYKSYSHSKIQQPFCLLLIPVA